MRMAAYMQAFKIESMMTCISGRVGNNPFGVVSYGLPRLECRARRILAHNSPIQQGCCGIQCQVVLCLGSQLPYHVLWVECRRRNHRKNLPRLGLNGDNRTELP